MKKRQNVAGETWPVTPYQIPNSDRPRRPLAVNPLRQMRALATIRTAERALTLPSPASGRGVFRRRVSAQEEALWIARKRMKEMKT
jgi:hypothetical protein